MHDKPDRRFIDAHPEGTGCHHHVQLVGEKGVENPFPDRRPETGMVGRGAEPVLP